MSFQEIHLGSHRLWACSANLDVPVATDGVRAPDRLTKSGQVESAQTPVMGNMVHFVLVEEKNNLQQKVEQSKQSTCLVWCALKEPSELRTPNFRIQRAQSSNIPAEPCGHVNHPLHIHVPETHPSSSFV